MKFKKKAAKVAILLGFKKKEVQSPTQNLDKPAKKMIKQVSYFLDMKAHPILPQSLKIAQINPGRERFDRIAGDKEVFMAHTLNYAYLDTNPVNFYFRLGSTKSDTIQVRIKIEWISAAGIQGMKFEASLYRYILTELALLPKSRLQ